MSVLKQKRRELYEVYDLAILTAAILSTGLALTASGEFVVVFHVSRSFLATELTTLLALLLACLLTLLALLVTLATASR